jgi:HAD superfamily hydrolase (TIGR01450 family)
VSFDDVPRISASRLLERYEAVLLDAYGVLITHDGVIPHAAAFIDRLNGLRKTYFVLTNDGSRSPGTSAQRFRDRGIAVPADRILTSMHPIGAFFRERGLRGSRCLVLGPEDSIDAVREAGGEPVGWGEDAEALVVADERGYDFLDGLDHAMNLVFSRAAAGKPILLVLANPDLIYPAREEGFGFTGGAAAALIEEAVRLRFPGRDDLRFVPMGKPHPPLFEEALRLAGTRNAVMVGDQLPTDIRGAHRAGIDSALTTTGITRLDAIPQDAPRPTWILESLEPS